MAETHDVHIIPWDEDTIVNNLGDKYLGRYITVYYDDERTAVLVEGIMLNYEVVGMDTMIVVSGLVQPVTCPNDLPVTIKA